MHILNRAQSVVFSSLMQWSRSRKQYKYSVTFHNLSYASTSPLVFAGRLLGSGLVQVSASVLLKFFFR